MVRDRNTNRIEGVRRDFHDPATLEKMMSSVRKTFAVLSALFLLTVPAFGKDRYHYVCLKCRLRIIKDTRPSSIRCKAGGSHEWNMLGKVGPRIHVCLKCHMLVSVASRPDSPHCKAGGSHDWFFLALRGKETYYCGKCGLKLRTSARPSSPHCKAGGSPEWIQY